MTITITLPDGSTREHEPGVTAGEIAASIGRGLAKAALAAQVAFDDGAGDWYDLNRPIDHDARVAIITPDSDDGREVLRHSTAHVHGAGGQRPLPRARSTPSARRSPTASTTTSSCPTAQHFSDDDLERIEARMREIVKADEPFVREELDREHAHRHVRRPALQGRDHRAGRPRRLRRGRRRQRHLGVPQPAPDAATPGVRRPLPRPARAVDQAPRRVQAHQGRGRVLARRREAPDAPAHLRHRVGVEGRARGAPPPHRGGREARPPQARRRSSTSSRSPTRSAPASPSSTRRAARSAA